MSKAITEVKDQINKHLSKTAINIFAALGFAFVAKKSLCALSATAYRLWRWIPKGTKNLAERYGQGSWALITGSTDGIGKSFAIALAKRGFNVIIFGRKEETLKKVSDLLTSSYGVQVKAIQADFSGCTKPEFFENIYKQTEGLDISILVNNVGSLKGTLFSTLDHKTIWDMNNLNLLPVAMLTRYYINDLLKRPKRSAIINLSSVGSRVFQPGFSIYGPGKAFADFLSENMAIEYKDKIDVLSVRPHYVHTPLYSSIGGSSNYCAVAPEKCAEGALSWLGRCSYYTYGATWHEIIGYPTENCELYAKHVLKYLGAH